MKQKKIVVLVLFLFVLILFIVIYVLGVGRLFLVGSDGVKIFQKTTTNEGKNVYVPPVDDTKIIQQTDISLRGNFKSLQGNELFISMASNSTGTLEKSDQTVKVDENTGFDCIAIAVQPSPGKQAIRTDNTFIDVKPEALVRVQGAASKGRNWFENTAKVGDVLTVITKNLDDGSRKALMVYKNGCR